MAGFLRACVVGRKNIIISGGTGSGKTTMLNAMSAYIDGKERVVTIEDSAAYGAIVIQGHGQFGALEVLVHRVIWSVVFLGILIELFNVYCLNFIFFPLFSRQ